MIETPKANRMHIALFGRTNAGKSSIINALINQELAVVSPKPGTTTDPVYKAMELLPLGPVVIIDTPGMDDDSTLGELRIEKALQVMDKTDLALVVVSATSQELVMEKEYIKLLKEKEVPAIVVVNKIDEKRRLNEEELKALGLPYVEVSALLKENIEVLKEHIIKYAPSDFEKESLLGDVVKKEELVLLVAPQDIQAPKGRLILPQVQVIRDLLDKSAVVVTVKDSELKTALKYLSASPALVITDSQVFKKVNEIIPKHVPLTSFSIIMAGYKGDLKSLIEGARYIESLKPGDKVLIAEGCTHHALKGDIAREKLPLWLKERAGGELIIEVKSGMEFPRDLTAYKLVLHCGACMFNRKQMMSRIREAKAQGVPITNYGTAIAYLNGILERTTEIFS